MIVQPTLLSLTASKVRESGQLRLLAALTPHAISLRDETLLSSIQASRAARYRRNNPRVDLIVPADQPPVDVGGLFLPRKRDKIKLVGQKIMISRAVGNKAPIADIHYIPLAANQGAEPVARNRLFLLHRSELPI